MPPKQVASRSDEYAQYSPRRRTSIKPHYLVYKDEDDEAQDVAIVLMGLTGSGKSTFVSLLTDQYVEVGHSLQACTSKASLYSFKHESGVSVNLIDTPGFDDTTRSDTEILKEIALILSEIYKEGVPLVGLIYFHRITDLKMSGSAMKSLRVFQKICGEDTYPSVVLATTMWDVLSKSPEGAQIGAKREDVLRDKDDFWGLMVKGGSRIMRHEGDQDTAKQIVDSLLRQGRSAALQLQREMWDQDKALDETTAGLFLQSELIEARGRHEKELQDLRRELQEAMEGKDDDMVSMISEQLREREDMIEQTDAARVALRVGYEELVAERHKESGKAAKDWWKEISQARIESCEKEIAELREQLIQVHTTPNHNQDLHERLRFQEMYMADTQREIQRQQRQRYRLRLKEIEWEEMRQMEERSLAKEEELHYCKKRATPMARVKSFLFSALVPQETIIHSPEPLSRRPTAETILRKGTKVGSVRLPEGGLILRNSA